MSGKAKRMSAFAAKHFRVEPTEDDRVMKNLDKRQMLQRKIKQKRKTKKNTVNNIEKTEKMSKQVEKKCILESDNMTEQMNVSHSKKQNGDGIKRNVVDIDSKESIEKKIEFSSMECSEKFNKRQSWPGRKGSRSSKKQKRSSENPNSDVDIVSKQRRLDGSYDFSQPASTAGANDYEMTVVVSDSDSEDFPVIYISDSPDDIGEVAEDTADTTRTHQRNRQKRQEMAKTGGTKKSVWTTGAESGTLRPSAVSTTEGALIFLPHPSEYILQGKASITLYAGQVVVQGYQLRPMVPVTVYSPTCNSLLTIKTLQACNMKKNIQQLSSSCNFDDASQAAVKTAIEKMKSFVLLAVTRHESVPCEVITSLDPFTRLFDVREDRTEANKVLAPLGIAVVSHSNVPCLEVDKQLDSLINLWTGHGGRKPPLSILVCGGKDSGKSTTNRLLLNSIPNRQEESTEPLYYLECDVGQSEFTPAGCVSLVEVTAPLLGPPFCNQRQPVYSYVFGGLSPRSEPDHYLACVRCCVQRYRQLDRPGRLVVNTMGWVTGLGYQLLVDIVRMVQPQCIVQLLTAQRHQNTEPITADSLLQADSWSDLTRGNSSSEGFDYQPTIIHLDRPITPEFQSKFRASDYRNLSLLSHLCTDLDPAVTFTSQLPYCIGWKDIAVHVCEEELPWQQVMYALNASLVALCRADLSQTERHVEDGPLFFKTLPICEWYSYGIVRGIDPDRKLLYVLSPLPLSKLERVNTLVKGAVTLPDKLLLTQKCKTLAYVDESKKSHGASSVKPRRHMPRKSLGPVQNS